MTAPQPQPDPLKLQAYLDGGLPDPEREAIAREMAGSSELREEAELQKRIDEVLRRSFSPPQPRAAAPRSDAVQPQMVNTTKQRVQRRRLAIAGMAAATSIVWAVLAWQFFSADSEAPNYDPNQPLGEIYEKLVAEGFKPKWVCEDEREFAATFQARQGQPLLLAAMPAGTKMEGLTYVGGLSRYTTAMLARVDDKPVLVFVDRANADTHPAEPAASSGLHLFRKELGPLVLYEITPLDHQAVMDYIRLTDAIPPPKR